MNRIIKEAIIEELKTGEDQRLLIPVHLLEEHEEERKKLAKIVKEHLSR